MSSRLAWLVTVVCLWVGLLSCAEGVPAAPMVQAIGAQPDAGSTCGNNIVEVEKGEQCDCLPTVGIMCAAPAGVTCEGLGMGGGVVYCTAADCTLNTMFCKSPGSGGSGGTGTRAGAGG